MRAFMLAVSGFVFSIAACSSYGTSVEVVAKQKAQVASVSLSVPASLVAGQIGHAVATPKDANGAVLADRPVAWFSSNASIAIVTDSGVISAVGPGTTTVSAVSEGVSAEASMAVTPPPPTPIATVTVAVSPSAVVIGQVAHATATMKDSTGQPLVGRPVTWRSSNTGIATVATTGDVTAVGPGAAMITATSQGVSASSELDVSVPAPIPVASISVSPATSTLQLGGTVQLSAVTRDVSNNVLTGRVVSWSSSNTGVSTVSTSGLVTAVAAGTATIAAASEGKTSSATITVNGPAPVPVASVSVSPPTSSLQVGATVQLSAVMRDANSNVLTGRAVLWSSSSTTVATVTSGGLVAATGGGSATITATSEGKTGTMTVTATLVPIASVTVSPATLTVTTGQTQQFTATLRDAAGKQLSGRTVAWLSSVPGIATVSASGSVRAVAVGTATITATSEGVNGTGTITVNAPAPPPPPGSSPEPVAGDQILLQDNFDGATVSAQLDPWATAGDFTRVTDGHSGAALRVSYESSSWNTNTIARDLSSTSTDAYYRYWYRLSPGADVTCGGRNWSGFKWFMTHRSDPNPRYTHGVSMISGGPKGFENVGMEFTTHDVSSTRQPNPFTSNINKTKRFNTTNDGQWHEYTLHVVTGGTGYEQIWIDGVKVLDSQGYGYDHAALGISSIAFPGTMVEWYSGCEWTIDIDDLVVWHH